MFQGFLQESLLKKAQERGSVVINIHDIRSQCLDKHSTADDAPFGGGPGMVMLAGPIIALHAQLKTPVSKTLLMTPAGGRVSQSKIKELSGFEHLIIICGHYEGIDERISGIVDHELSIGDFVLTGGELPAACVVDAICRYVPGVVKEADSVEQDSFTGSVLDCPHYTRPAEQNGIKAPDELLSGHHEEIRKWRRKQSLRRTLLRRPDLLPAAPISPEDKKLFQSIILKE